MAILAVISLAGCTALGAPKPVYQLESLPAHLPAEAGSGPFALNIEVRKESGDGDPVANASVNIYPMPNTYSFPPPYTIHKQNATMALRTDANGRGVVHLTEGKYYGFFATKEGFTVDWRYPIKPTAKEFGAKPLIIPLFPSSREIECKSSIPPRVSSPYAGKLIWYFTNLTFHANPSSQLSYLSHLAHLDAVLTWTPGPTDSASFAIRIGFNPNYVAGGSTTSITLSPGGGPTSIRWPVDHFWFSEGLKQRPTTLMVGAATQGNVVAPPSGIPITLHLKFDLSTDPADPSYAYRPLASELVPGDVPQAPPKWTCADAPSS